MRDVSCQNIIMRVEDSFQVQGLGTIVSGSNQALDEWDEARIRGLIGDSIDATGPDGPRRRLRVKAVEIRASLAGRKNLNIALADDVTPADVPRGTVLMPAGAE